MVLDQNALNRLPEHGPITVRDESTMKIMSVFYCLQPMRTMFFVAAPATHTLL